jgi:hypothetical protein
MNNQFIKKCYVINELTGEVFKLGKGEKDVVCGLMDVDFTKHSFCLMEKDQAKLEKITEQLKSEDDKKRLAPGELVPSWYIFYCWYTCFESQAEIENQEENSYPSFPIRAVQCRTLKTLQEKGLIKVESLGLVNQKFYGLTPEGSRIADKLTN